MLNQKHTFQSHDNFSELPVITPLDIIACLNLQSQKYNFANNHVTVLHRTHLFRIDSEFNLARSGVEKQNYFFKSGLMFATDIEKNEVYLSLPVTRSDVGTLFVSLADVVHHVNNGTLEELRVLTEISFRNLSISEVKYGQTKNVNEGDKGRDMEVVIKENMTPLLFKPFVGYWEIKDIPSLTYGTLTYYYERGLSLFMELIYNHIELTDERVNTNDLFIGDVLPEGYDLKSPRKNINDKDRSLNYAYLTYNLNRQRLSKQFMRSKSSYQENHDNSTTVSISSKGCPNSIILTGNDVNDLIKIARVNKQGGVNNGLQPTGLNQPMNGFNDMPVTTQETAENKKEGMRKLLVEMFPKTFGEHLSFDEIMQKIGADSTSTIDKENEDYQKIVISALTKSFPEIFSNAKGKTDVLSLIKEGSSIFDKLMENIKTAGKHDGVDCKDVQNEVKKLREDNKKLQDALKGYETETKKKSNTISLDGKDPFGIVKTDKPKDINLSGSKGKSSKK